MSPVLTSLAAILRDAVDGYDTEARTLARLRAASFTPDPRAVTDAVAAIRTLRGLADGSADPVLLTEGAAISPTVDRRALAVAEQERRLDEACVVLARRAAA